jgi:hypothetical protein
VQRHEVIRRRRDGSSVDISLTVSPIRDETGPIIGASQIASDIRERNRAEQALRESEERFRNLANTVPDIVWIADPDDRRRVRSHLRQKPGAKRTRTVNSSSRPRSIASESSHFAPSGRPEKLPAGPISGPRPGPTFASAVSAPDIAVM